MVWAAPSARIACPTEASPRSTLRISCHEVCETPV
jgi:hypothetical protein